MIMILLKCCLNDLYLYSKLSSLFQFYHMCYLYRSGISVLSSGKEEVKTIGKYEKYDWIFDIFYSC